ncbi:hypothetical protein NH621_10260 [Lactococcus formosensis]|uniref:hypothetical protein n=1 Tax=Lactococcus formosensis TaxID=1281486 RepID=UPI002097EDC2|nr:hypothetical protein [Lactococcus formosensis]MCO7181547.1 hypothetical protein [Lactococcus formosensis]
MNKILKRRDFEVKLLTFIGYRISFLYAFKYEWINLKQKVLSDLLLSTGTTDLRFLNVPKVFVNAEVTKQAARMFLKHARYWE